MLVCTRYARASSIGKEVAKLAKGFGAKVVYCKRNRLAEIEEKKLGVDCFIHKAAGRI